MVLQHYHDALALVTVAHRSLEAQESRHVGPEDTVLRIGIADLDAVYDELDAAVSQLWRATR